MECEEIKKIIPGYFKHTATEEEVKQVEEHLCICHECRTALGELMDEVSQEGEPAVFEGQDQEAKEPPAQEKPQEPVQEPIEEPKKEEEVPLVAEEELIPLSEDKEGMEYFPGEAADESAAGKKSDAKSEPEPAEPLQEEKAHEPEPTEFLAEEPAESKPVFIPEEEPPKAAEPQGQEPPKEEPSLPSEAELVPAPEEEAPKPAKEETAPVGASIESTLKEASVPEEKESLPPEEDLYSLDEHPIEKSKVGIFEYVSLGVGVVILLFVIYLLTKG